MDRKEELLTEILKRVQRNYVHMVEIERLTKGDGRSCDEDAAGRDGSSQ